MAVECLCPVYEANYIHFNAGIRFKSSCILPVNTGPDNCQ